MNDRRKMHGCIEYIPAWPHTHLGEGTDEARSRGPAPVVHAAEDSRDPIGLGEQGRVADGERRAQAHPPQRADGGRGLGQEEEGHDVGHEDAQEQNVAQLSARRLDQRRVVVSDEHPEHQARRHEPVAASKDQVEVDV